MEFRRVLFRSLRQQGIACEQADAWETKVQFAGGQLMLNGQRIF